MRRPGRCVVVAACLAALGVGAGCATEGRESPPPPFEWPEEPSPEETARQRQAVAKKAFAALRAGDVATVETLLEAHPHLVHATDLVLGGERATLWGNPSLLHLAIQDKHYGLAERLIEAGANVTRPDDQGLTPLDYAAVPGAENLVKRLLAAGADPNARHPTYGTPLHKAMEHADCHELVGILLAHGADPAAGDGGAGRRPDETVPPDAHSAQDIGSRTHQFRAGHLPAHPVPTQPLRGTRRLPPV
jgi:hypothetical protein